MLNLEQKINIADIPLDWEDLSSAELNIEGKERSNLFPWNGQFSPQFVEAILNCYSQTGDKILDPFCGSGTVLAEAGLLGYFATGIELNPAAFILSRTYSLCNVDKKHRTELCNSIERQLQSVLPKGWPLLFLTDIEQTNLYKEKLLQLHNDLGGEDRALLETFIILADFFKGISTLKLAKIWGKLRQVVEQLPYSASSINLIHADGRFPKGDDLFDLVLTSPPYINVYNYHQQYRASAEALGWDLLHVAKTEIGSNRKNRGNRFLTVIQYCLDLALCLHSLWSVTTKNARLIFILGRESKVRGVPFLNGEITANIAVSAIGYQLIMRQERVFTNRFGQNIYEDILHFKKKHDAILNDNPLQGARVVAEIALRRGLKHASSQTIVDDLENAIQKIGVVEPSPRFFSQPLPIKQDKDTRDALPNTSSRKTKRNTRKRQTAGA